MDKVAVIGAGPIGCYTAYLLAKEGYRVAIFENHPKVGSPIQCTGILTNDYDKLGFPLDPYLVHIIDSIDVFSPNNKVTVKQKDYIICRNKFDNYFANLAIDAGAKLHLNHTLLGKENGFLIIKDTFQDKVKKIQADIVIGADGPLSPTAKAYAFYHPERDNYFGVQATVEGDFSEKTIKTYFGNDICPGLFAWICPESNTKARVGLAMKKNSRKYFDDFMGKFNFTAVDIQAGAIPVYQPKQLLRKENCYLVGDASTYVKATTLGGLVPALQQAQILVDCIVNKKDYSKEITPIRKQMVMHLKIQKMFSKFSDKDWDRLVGYVAKPKIQRVFEKYTRDNPIPLVINALLREPRFMLFGKYLI